MKNFISYLEERHILNEMQRAFGEMVLRRCNLVDKQSDDGLALYALAAITLKVTQDDHSCLDIAAWCQKQLDELEEMHLAKDKIKAMLEQWQLHVLQLKTDAVACPENEQAIDASPLVLCKAGFVRVYLNRIYHYERQVEAKIRSMAKNISQNYDLAELKTEVHEASKHFCNKAFETDDQQQAVFHAVQSNFSIVTGGPGRGKTTVLTDILALELKFHPQLRIALCAPTGKAAARMRQSISNALKMDEKHPQPDLNYELFGQEIFCKLTELRPQTVHTLLGLHVDTDYPQANSQNPLEYDLIAVDECSMMSLQLFYQLLGAIKPETKLILLGDENQLASVDEGVVLAELCHAEELNGKTGTRIVNRLTVNHRSDKNEALCAYTDAIVGEEKQPDVDSFFSKEASMRTPLFAAEEINTEKSKKQLYEIVEKALNMAGLKEELKKVCNWREAYSLLDRFKVLSPVREGSYGVLNINAIIRKVLGIQETYGNGVPIMVTKNDKVTGLNNGDIGVCFDEKVYFITLRADGTEDERCYSPAQLPPHETAFAMTIHKSQGSDYANVLMVLPPQKSALLTRELIYTGISRAKMNLLMLADKNILIDAQQRRIQRWSYLMR